MREFTVALAGNPNVGKSTVFNALTGMHQHTGNWPGKTVASAEGSFRRRDMLVHLVDLPGTYSLLAHSAEEEVARMAKERQVTRATISMEKAAQIKKPVIFAIGNAPTALVRLYELIQDKKISPELIIGVPVGFVNVVQSKELIMETDVPYIVAKGRKGGSNIAACICNALLYMIDNKRD